MCENYYSATVTSKSLFSEGYARSYSILRKGPLSKEMLYISRVQRRRAANKFFVFLFFFFNLLLLLVGE